MTLGLKHDYVNSVTIPVSRTKQYAKGLFLGMLYLFGDLIIVTCCFPNQS
jgi:hypothetical protein